MADLSRPRRAGATTTADSFERRVLRVVSLIPPGRVATYGDVAARAGRPRAARAVGNIMRRANQPGLPYHRVVAAGGLLGGYGSSPQLKRSLLLAEGHTIRGRRIIDFGRRRL
jgi:O-6-methylguanine DNA methyltransferase